MMAVLKLTGMFSYFLLGWFGRFYEPLGAPAFWAANGMVALTAMLAMIALRRPLLRVLRVSQA